MKKIILALLALTLCFSSACGGNENTSVPTTVTTESKTATVQDATVDSQLTTETQTNTSTTSEESTTVNSSNTELTTENTDAYTEPTTASTVNKNTEPSTANTISKSNETTTTSITNIANENVLKTDFFSITMPESWKGQYTSKVIEGKHLMVNHKKSADAGYGGNLFSVEMFTADEDYTVLPVYTYLNTIEDNHGKIYDVVFVLSSDVQCPEELIDEYTSFANQANSISKTIKYTNKAKVIQ